MLRGVLLRITKNRSITNGYDIVMTKAEEIGQHWIKGDGYTTRLKIQMKRKRFIQPGLRT